MIIYCDTMTDFLDVIEGLTKKGIGFKANGTTFKIELTGAF